MSTAKRVCVSASESNTWHPAQLTTYVLSVYEIEQLISALKSKVTSVLSSVDASGNPDPNRGKDAANLQKQVSNWQAVLSDYRSHNTGKLTSPFQRETSLFMNAVKAYNSWSSSADANNDGSFQGVLDKSISELSNYGHPSKDTYGSSHPLFLSRIDQSMRALDNACTQIDLPDTTYSYSYSYGATSAPTPSPKRYANNAFVQSICAEYASFTNTNTVTDFYDAISNACEMQDLSTGGKSLMSELPSMQTLCQGHDGKRTAVPVADQSSHIFGLKGITDTGGDSMLAFLNDNTKLITFGSSSPVTMSWTSVISDSVGSTFSVQADPLYTNEAGGVINGQIVFLYDSFNTLDTKERGDSNSYGKTESSSRSNERTISVTLEDNDLGNI